MLSEEVHLWDELINSITLNKMLWLRTAVTVKVLWKKKYKVNKNLINRLMKLRKRLIVKNISAEIM